MATKYRGTSDWWERASLLHDYGIDPEARQIFMGSMDTLEEGEETGVDYSMAASVLCNLRLLDSASAEPILLHQCSVGGEWEYGMAIYDAISACRSPVIALCHAHARSMTSIIPQAADYRVMMPNALFMIHYGEAWATGTKSQVLSFAEELNRSGQRMLDIYVEVCRHGENFKRWSRNRIREFLHGRMREKEEWYITARQAVQFGFADAVLGDEGYETIEDLAWTG